MNRSIWYLLIALVLLPACQKSDPLVGRWTTRAEGGAVEMELTKDHKLLFGENNGTWQWTDDGKVLLSMNSGTYVAEFQKTILHFVVGDRDVVFSKN